MLPSPGARKRLYLTAALTRRIFGQTNANPVSRFIGKIPNELRRSIGVGSSGFSGSGWEKRGSRRGIAGSGTEAGGGRVFGQSSASNAKRDARSASVGKKPAAAMSFAVNDTVDHKVFGRGTVVKVDGDTLHVKFARNNQTKKLHKDYAADRQDLLGLSAWFFSTLSSHFFTIFFTPFFMRSPARTLQRIVAVSMHAHKRNALQ